MCKHLVAACILEKVALPGMRIAKAQSLRCRRRRGRKVDAGISYSPLGSPEPAPMPEPALMLEPEVVPQQTTPKKKGKRYIVN